MFLSSSCLLAPNHLTKILSKRVILIFFSESFCFFPSMSINLTFWDLKISFLVTCWKNTCEKTVMHATQNSELQWTKIRKKSAIHSSQCELHIVKFQKNIDFSLWGNSATTHIHVCYCSIFSFLEHCDIESKSYMQLIQHVNIIFYKKMKTR